MAGGAWLCSSPVIALAIILPALQASDIERDRGRTAGSLECRPRWSFNLVSHSPSSAVGHTQALTPARKYWLPRVEAGRREDTAPPWEPASGEQLQGVRGYLAAAAARLHTAR
eukprot:GHVU01210369.1.p1 GENE.GHVU01210369.1~~GHVU01210369.1.p1  ORF type:complete len:113 (+),score=1.47 GHVU01210369.1:327-665(+)